MLTQETIDKLRVIQKRISEHPVKFFMQQYFAGRNNQNKTYDHIQDVCGTAACIGGWALAEKEMQNSNVDFDSAVANWSNLCNNQNPYDAAKAELNLTADQAGRLFCSQAWPVQFGKHYAHTDKALTYEQRMKNARLAVARIEHFINTGGDE